MQPLHGPCLISMPIGVSTALLIRLGAQDFGSQVFQKTDSLADVLLLLGRIVGDFPLDGQRAFVADLAQSSQVCLDADVSLAQRDFAAPLLASIGGCPLGVLAM